MILGDRFDNPKLLIVVGMAVLALAESWPRFLPVGRGLSPDRVDGIRGLLFGIAIGLLLWSARLNGCGRCGSGDADWTS